MQKTPLRIVILGMERLLPKDLGSLDARLRKALSGVDATGAVFAGHPHALAQHVAGLFGAQTAADDTDPDLIVLIWNGMEDPQNALWQRADALIEARGEDAVLRVVLHDDNPESATVDYVDTFGVFAHDALILSCPADAADAERVLRTLRGIRISREASQRSGHRQLQNLLLSTGETLLNHEKALMAQIRYLVVLVSQNSVRTDKVNDAVNAFIAARGKEFVQLVLVGAENAALPNPTVLFPRALLGWTKRTDPATGETEDVIISQPLACNFTAEKVPKQQKYRLAAPLFGISYEDLNRRMWAQRLRRTAIISGVLAVIAITVAATLLTTGLNARREQQQAEDNRAIALVEAATEREAATEAALQAENAHAQAKEAATAAATAQNSATFAKEKARAAATAAATAIAKQTEAEAAATLARQAATLESVSASEAQAAESDALAQQKLAEQAATEASIAASEAEAAADEASREAENARIQAATAQAEADIAQAIADEAVERGADALAMQAIRLTREATQAADGGNTLQAISLLLEATPNAGSKRALDPRAEMSLRTLMGQGEIFPVLTLPGYIQPEIIGNTLYAVNGSGRAAAWDLLTGDPVDMRDDWSPAIDRPIGTPAVAIEDKTFTVDARGYAQLRDADGYLLEEIQAHTPGRPQGLLQALDGRRIVSHTATETVVWGVVPGNARTVISAHNGPVASLDVDTKGFTTGGQDGRVFLWNPDGTQRLAISTGKAISTVETLPEHGLIATCATDGTVSLWRDEDGSRLWSERFDKAGVARISPDGTRVVVGPMTDYHDLKGGVTKGAPFTGYLLDASNGQTIATFSTDGIAWSNNIFYRDRFVAGEGSRLTFYAIEDGFARLVYPENIYAYWVGAAITPDGFAYSPGCDMYNVMLRYRMFNIYTAHSGPGYMAASPVQGDFTFKFVSSALDYTAMVDHAVQTPYVGAGDLDYVLAHRYRHQGPIVGCEFDSEGRYAITASRDGNAAVLGDDGLLQLLRNGYPLTWANFLPDGSAAITVDDEGRIVLWPLGDFLGVRARAEELMKP